MIIKSMARKEWSFAQLVSYMEKDSCEKAVFHNLYGHDGTSAQEIVREFEENASWLPGRRNGNVLYHEIISLSSGHWLDRVASAKVLADIGYEYLARRAPAQIAYGVVHNDTEHPHLHICISANQFGAARRSRLSKKEFSRIQKEMEELVRKRYPEICQEALYAKGRGAESVKTTRREQEMKKRTGLGSSKECLADCVRSFLQRARSEPEFTALLASEGLSMYVRWKHFGITDSEGKRHRLEKLGLAAHYATAMELFSWAAPSLTEDEVRKRLEAIESALETGRNAAEGRERIPGEGRRELRP